MPPALLPEIRSVDYLVRDAAGNAVGSTIRSGYAVAELIHVRIPRGPGLSKPPPGSYTIEVWFEGHSVEGATPTRPCASTMPDLLRCGH